MHKVFRSRCSYPVGRTGAQTLFWNGRVLRTLAVAGSEYSPIHGRGSWLGRSRGCPVVRTPTPTPRAVAASPLGDRVTAPRRRRDSFLCRMTEGVRSPGPGVGSHVKEPLLPIAFTLGVQELPDRENPEIQRHPTKCLRW